MSTPEANLITPQLQSLTAALRGCGEHDRAVVVKQAAAAIVQRDAAFQAINQLLTGYTFTDLDEAQRVIAVVQRLVSAALAPTEVKP